MEEAHGNEGPEGDEGADNAAGDVEGCEVAAADLLVYCHRLAGWCIELDRR